MRLLPIGCLLLTGCAAAMVNRPGSRDPSSPYAPVNEANRPGMIKYLNEGADSIIHARREDAYKQMFEACNGKYSITSEGPRAEGGMVVPTVGGIAYSEDSYWYINFKCE